MSTYSYQANEPTDGQKTGAVATTAIMLASPFISVAAVNSLIYGAPVMSSANGLIPVGMIAGNALFPGIGGLAGGVGVAMYAANYPLTRALVIGVGAGLVEVAIGLALVEIWVKGGSQKQ